MLKSFFKLWYNARRGKPIFELYFNPKQNKMSGTRLANKAWRTIMRFKKKKQNTEYLLDVTEKESITTILVLAIAFGVLPVSAVVNYLLAIFS